VLLRIYQGAAGLGRSEFSYGVTNDRSVCVYVMHGGLEMRGNILEQGQTGQIN
jgi:hypothetical protein